MEKNQKQYQNKGKSRNHNPNQTFNRDRKQSLCPVSKQCGGCQWIDVPYAMQLARKQEQLTKLLKSYVKPEKVIGMQQPFHYRNKVHAAFGMSRKGPVSGIYKAGSHEIVPIDSCLIENEKADAIIVTIRSLLRSFKIKTYDEDSGYGLLRHVLIRIGHNSGEIMVVLVLTSPILPSKNNFVKALCKEHPEITTVVVNVNDRRTSMVLGEKEQVIYGKGYITDTLCGKTFRISPKSFYQVNSTQTEVLYRQAMEYAGLTGKETVLDAYCGTGTIGIIASEGAKQVLGVELNKDAVKDAVLNAKTNQVKNIQFYNQDAGKFMEEMAEQGATADVVFMDPPRVGSDETFLSSLVKLSPKRIVYVSCNPETLARDLNYLTKHGYTALKAVGVDMFAMTDNVETVVLLSQQKPDDVIEVEIELDELDLTSAESKATYKEIQEYVLKKHGLKVSNLYISQVKRKCGLEVGENYNLPKSEDSRQPQCPVAKEKAIKDALEHFGMI